MNRPTICLAMAVTALGGPAVAAMTLSSSDIKPGGPIAQAQVDTRCGGQNISPRLAWSGPPPGARSLVLTMIDLDVKPAQWSHWIVVDLPPVAGALPRAATTLPGHARAIENSRGAAEYTGPCPPAGSGPHRYKFTIWAMPTPATTVQPKARADALAASLAKQAIGSASFVGVVQR